MAMSSACAQQPIYVTAPDLAPVDTATLLTPDDFGIPHRRCFTPPELAPYFMVSADTIIRMIEDGMLRALPMRGGTYKIPWIEVCHFFMRQQGAMS